MRCLVRGGDWPRKLFAGSALVLAATAHAATPVFISEIHYDNVGTDTGEAIEIAGPAGTDLTGWRIVRYNGTGGAEYSTPAQTASLPASIPGTPGTTGFMVITFAQDGLQNGSPDGIALVDGTDAVAQFLSYEGVFSATNGPAAGQTSIDIGVAESSSTPVGASLQLTGTGNSYEDFTWTAAASQTFGVVNNGQTFGLPNGGPSITRLHAIQGSGGTVTGAGPFTVEAIVVGDFQTQGNGQLRGFFLQEEDADADADPATSEGIFVFCSSCPVAVQVGDRVRVTGSASDFFGMSQLSATAGTSVTVLDSGNALPTPAELTLPVPGVPNGDLAVARSAIDAYFERSEGMLVRIPGELTVAEYFELARYGQLVLAAGGRPRQFTDQNPPTAAGFIEHQIDFAGRSIILDDDNNVQNDAITGTDKPYFWPRPGLSVSNYLRGGDTIANVTGVLHWSFAGQGGTDAWRIRPVEPAFAYAFTPANPRPAAPSVGGSVRVASFNVLNYFLTPDLSDICGPLEKADCRGADSEQELDRQRAKLTRALLELDADVIGLIELENTPDVEPLETIVQDLADAGAGSYAYVDTGLVGTDAIRVGIIYRADRVTPVGDSAVLDDPEFVNPFGAALDRNRPALAQSFTVPNAIEPFTVVVNHLKSKGSGCGAGDDDTTTGQGNCNGTRTAAAEALASWLALDPTDSGSPNVLVIGDLNAYRREDPVTALANAGYVDLIDRFSGPEAYSYLFGGQLGYLDHALASAALASKVTGVAEWHINADELPVFDYNDDVRDAGEASFERESAAATIYAEDPYRTSDHDPLLVGLDLVAPTLDVTVSPTRLWPANHRFVTVNATVTASDDSGSEPVVKLVSVTSDEPDNGRGDGNTVSDIVIVDDTTVRLRAERSGTGTGRTYTLTYSATDAAGNTTLRSVTVSVPSSMVPDA